MSGWPEWAKVGDMTEKPTPDEPQDPRDRMKAALEAKNAKSRQGADGQAAHLSGHGPKAVAKAAGKREFRRKSGG